ncbi:MAG: RiPP maturation radical SAM C-methyltransferase [Planctomycetota bacterium]
MMQPKAAVERSRGGVLLVVPPFIDLTRPALGVSQLKANLEAQGFPTEVLYLNLRFAERLGVDRYETIQGRLTYYALAGEMIFSHVLFNRSDEDLERYVAEVLVPRRPKEGTTDTELQQSAAVATEMLRGLIREAREFCEKEAVDEILARDPWLVGLTSTFQQNCASLAVIQAIKKRRPDILTIMGGPNCEAEMGEEIFARFPALDLVGQGECDLSMVELVRHLKAGGSGAGIPGILTRNGGERVRARQIQSEELDKLPFPDFTDYFQQLSEFRYRDRIIPALVMETSRGCWWGAKNHCTFCGLNALGMAYRSKSPARVLEQIEELVNRYGVTRIEVIDNILDMQYFKTVLPRLAERPLADLTFETKANLSREQVRLLARANIRWIQPGIESLSDRSLELMKKGVTGLQNIQLLKWCMEDGIRVSWNHLLGFPGERLEDLERVANDAPALHHLQPPGGPGPLHLDRFSPYHVAPEKYGLEPIYPMAPYKHIYPFPDEALTRIAYMFESPHFKTLDYTRGWDIIERMATTWKRAHRGAHLIEIRRGRSLILLDTRACAKRRLRRLRGLALKLYEHCGRIRGEAEILRTCGDGYEPEQVLATLRSLVEDRLVLEVDGHYLSLGTPVGPSYRNYFRVYPPGEVVKDSAARRGVSKRGAVLRRLIHAMSKGRPGLKVREISAVTR